MPSLADFLKAYMQEHGLTLRDMEIRSKVSKTVLHNLISGRDHEPRLSTLEGIASVVGLPLWRVVELAGVNLGLPEAPSDNAERLGSLALRNTDLRSTLSRLIAAEPHQIRSILGYLEADGGEEVQDLRITMLGDRQRALLRRLLELQPALLPDLPPRQNVYEGVNRKDKGGALTFEITVNGLDLAQVLGWKRNLAWGYLGAGPLALSEAILRHEYGQEPPLALRNQFYDDVTSTLPQGRERTGRIWSLESQEIDVWYVLTRLIEQATPSAPPVARRTALPTPDAEG